MIPPGHDDDTAPQPVLRFDDVVPAGPSDPAPGTTLPAPDRRPRRRRHVLVVAAVTAAVVAIGATSYAITRQSPAAAAGPAPDASQTLDLSPSPVAAAPLSSQDADPLAPSRDTLVLGDSLALIVYPWLADLLPDRYVSYVAEVGSSAEWALHELEGMKARGERIPKVVLISAGTNDFSSADFRTHATAILDLLGPKRCVAWSTVARPDVVNGYQVDPASDLDGVLADLTASHPNLRLMDWVGLVGEHPDWLAGDGLHPIEAGAIARAKQFADASAACSPIDPDAPVADKQYLPNSAFFPGGATSGTTGTSGSSGSYGSSGGSGTTHSATPTQRSTPRPSKHATRSPSGEPSDDTSQQPGGGATSEPQNPPADSPAPQDTAAGTAPPTTP